MKFLKRLCCLLLCALLCLVPCAGIEDSSIVFHSHVNGEDKIAITFDDGPHPRYTPQILSILEEFGVRATFFVVGENVEYYPDLIGRILAAGHEIGNHTYDHGRMPRQTVEQMKKEILRTEGAVYELSDYRTKVLRPPEGMLNDSVIEAARALDYRVVLWNIDTRDWDHTPPEKIAEQILAQVQSGDIILMHDYIGRNSPTPEALRLVLPELLRRGYRFVGISELLDSQ
ncbi:MAG: polysaccharide deacetylase family protein [Ruminococcaceae bacterium]|nr:polysaccharide deacetylase family protein [Oscillospiraceae bacterium]